MSTFIAILATMGLVMLLLPILVFYCVKLGTYAYLRGRYLFRKQHPDIENLFPFDRKLSHKTGEDNGNTPST